MILKNTKLNRKDHGFTIVELLVVIVVIGILASITIVSYTGITTKANNSKSQNNAQTALSVAETYFADNASPTPGYYPATVTQFMTGGTIAKIPSGMTILVGSAGTSGTQFATTDLTAANGGSSIGWACTSAAGCASALGGRITYWDFTTNARSTTVLYVGNATATSVFYAPGA